MHAKTDGAERRAQSLGNNNDEEKLLPDAPFDDASDVILLLSKDAGKGSLDRGFYKSEECSITELCYLIYAFSKLRLVSYADNRL